MKTEDVTTKNFYSKRTFWSMNLIWIIVLIIILLLAKSCSEKVSKEKNNEYLKLVQISTNDRNALNKKIDSLKTALDESKEVKAVLEIKREKGGSKVNAKIVPLNESGVSEKFISDKIAIRKISVPKECPECPTIVLDSCKEKVCLDSLSSILDIQLKKIDKDTIRNLYRSFLPSKWLISLNSELPYGDFANYTFLEYTKNKYSALEEKSFRWGLIFAAASVGLYATSEAVGHPKYWDNQDNFNADKKSHLIKGLRFGSAVFGIASALEFGRTIYFHKKHKLYISPTTISLKINIDKDK